MKIWTRGRGFKTLLFCRHHMHMYAFLMPFRISILTSTDRNEGQPLFSSLTLHTSKGVSQPLVQMLPNLQRVEPIRFGRVGRDCVEYVDQHQEEGHEERHSTLKKKLDLYNMKIC